MTTLGDLGERAIVRDIIGGFVRGSGDDCAIIDFGFEQLVLTTDPVPPPAASVIAGDPDPFWAGWLLVIINASDLAAAGASPLAFLAAIEAPPDYKVDDFKRLLTGVREACDSENLTYAGGNIREARQFAAVGFAAGRCAGRPALRRSGARDGDLLVSVGAGGVFWRDALKVRAGGSIEPEKSPLFMPRSQMKAMSMLAERGLVSAAIDNSDGLIPSLSQIADANSLIAICDLDTLTPPAGAESLGIDPARCWLGWGDWNVVAAVSRDSEAAVQDVARSSGTAITCIGELKSGESSVVLRRGGREKAAPRIESERFSPDSWFSSGIDGYVEILQTADLP